MNKDWAYKVEERLKPVAPYIGYTISAGLATVSMIDLYFAINGNHKIPSSVVAALLFALAYRQARQARTLQKQR